MIAQDPESPASATTDDAAIDVDPPEAAGWLVR